MSDYETYLDQRLTKSLRHEDKSLERLEKRENAALFYVGKLCREGTTIFYINVRNSRGMPNGKVKEFDSRYQAIDYLVRNNYV